VEDLYADLERLTREGRTADLPAFFERRITQPDVSIDGVLCWDLFDYIDRAAARALALQLSRVLRPGGALLGFFATARETDLYYTKYTIVDDLQLQRRTYPATRGRQPVLLNRDIIQMFEGLLISDSFLLKTNTRLTRAAGYLMRPRSSDCAEGYRSLHGPSDHRAAQRLWHARSLCRHDERCGAGHLSRRDAHRHLPRRPAA
jgi:hypothetical protein